MLKTSLFACLLCATPVCAMADVDVASPDGRLLVTVGCQDGRLTYSASYDGRQALLPSRLGLKTDIADFSAGLAITGHRAEPIAYDYTMRGTKASHVSKKANRLDVDVSNAAGQTMTLRFQLTDNDIAFQYRLQPKGDDVCATVESELTSFRPAEDATSFLSPQSDPMIGWRHTKPSYEEVYKADAPLTQKSLYGRGYVFPCLFKEPAPAAAKGSKNQAQPLWILVSETGTDGRYAGCHLTDYDPATGYQIALPMDEEAHGYGQSHPNLLLPAATPWRTVTIADGLAPIVETTAAYDVVEPRYAVSPDCKPGRYTWSWLVWQDNSINYDDQVRFIDLAAKMGYEYTLVDGCWDTQIGRDRMAQLAKYAATKGVRLLLWYNSNGLWNDAPQTPKHRMNTVAARRAEMAWLKSIGAAGIKVDFFGGDKQPTIQLYEDILADANDFGLQVIFHGCTLPRGWERMYPNFAGSEAVLASENVYFDKGHAAREPFDLTLHPFCRNTVASMDWGGTIMNRMMSKDNKSRHARTTTDVFEMASAVVNQCSVQGILVQPNTVDELNATTLDFLRGVPTQWDETRFLCGYPGQYVALTRRSGERSITAALNGTDTPRKLTLTLPYPAGTKLRLITDGADGAVARTVTVGKRQTVELTLAPRGGAILER